MLAELGTSMSSENLNARLSIGGQAPVFERVEGIDYSSDEMTRRFPVFGEICRKYDVGFGCVMNLEKSDGDFIGMATLRGRRQGHAAPGTSAAISAIAPHVLDAIRLRRVIEQESVGLVRGALEAISAACFFFDTAGRVVGLTGSAERMLGISLQVKSRRLSTASPAQSAVLLAAVRRAANEPSTPHRSLVVRGFDGAPCVLNIAPMPALDAGLGRSPRAIVTVRGLRDFPGPPVLAEALGITLAEAEVVAMLGNGLSREAIAVERGTALVTVRTQIKAIFSKLGIRREAELMSLIRRL
jgi:DNA-binding CsgD family transcriptional regulator